MSIWTHVAAVVRIDDIGAIFGDSTDWNAYFGKELHYEDDLETWEEAEEHPERFLPMGSEGSLTLHIWENPNENDLNRYNVMIFGDLRDRDNPNKILEWFKEKIAGITTAGMVRQAVITIETEYDETITWTYEKED